MIKNMTKKTSITKTVAKRKKAVKKTSKPSPVSRYIEAVGRRKTAVARVRITEATKTNFVINDKDLHSYFPTDELRSIVRDALSKSKVSTKFNVSGLVKGGGIHAQAQAMRHGIARALVSHDKEIRGKIKKLGFLKRDPRVKERKKPGLKKARKAAQWSKR
ncbi:MAG: 30S ribosomal protein S9 [Patescibacteria group bacterium]|nr:MAG: 30S ribosomal protein S9 [Patescibacteria group bacterium]